MNDGIIFAFPFKSRMPPTPILAEKPIPYIGPKKGLAGNKTPNFFIVGGPKCGTTALDHYFSVHPDVFVAKKEMHHFGADLRFGSQFYRRDRDAYLAEFESWNGQACVGESSVWCLFSREAAAEIKAFNPDARIIIMLREPVAMMYSLYYQFRCDGNEHLPTFEEALAAEEDRRAGRRISRQAYFPQGLIYRATVRYAEQVERYFEAFGRERVHVIIYDDFAADSAGVYADALNFLGVAPAAADVDFKVINGNKSVRSPLMRAILYDPLVRGTAIALRDRVPRPIFRALQKFENWFGSLNTRPEKRLPMARALQLSLRREFAPEVERLSALLGRDLTHWSEPEPGSR
jgi:Sulfotransferase domain